jgi:DNA-binding transcriptional LysR family regulator
MVEAGVGVGIMPMAAARRHARTMAIAWVPLHDEWAVRELQVCTRNVANLPPFARDLIDLLVADAATAAPPSPR